MDSSAWYLDPATPHYLMQWSIFGFALLVLRDAWRRGVQWVSTYLWAIPLGAALECFIVKNGDPNSTSPSHYYDYCTTYVLSLRDILQALHLPAPHWTNVTMWVAVGWGIILYSCTWTAQRLRLPVGYRPVVAGLLAVSIDVSLDPVAHMVGFWTWHRTGSAQEDPFHFLHVPYDNFVAWFGIVAMYAWLVRWFLRVANQKIPRGWLWTLVAVLAPLAAALCEFALYFAIAGPLNRLYDRLSLRASCGEGEALVFMVPLGLGLTFLALAMMRSRRSMKVNWTILFVPFYFHLLCLFFYWSSCKVWDAASLLAILPTNLLWGVVLFAWPSLDTLLRIPDQAVLDEVRTGLVSILEPLKLPTLQDELTAYANFTATPAQDPPPGLLAARLARTVLARDTHAYLLRGGKRESSRSVPDFRVLADSLHQVLDIKGPAAIGPHPARRIRLRQLADQLVLAADRAARFRRVTLSTYGGETREVRFVTPRDRAELVEVLAYAKRRGWAVTPRAGGHAFDTQSLGGGLVVSLENFSEIIVDETNATVRVGAGATWEKVLDEVLSCNLVPHVMVTSKSVTAGGSASGHSVARFSITCGREGDHVRSVDLMLPNGTEVTCSRSSNADLFEAVIGGLGHVGLVLSLEYELLRVPGGWGGVSVETMFTPFEGLQDLARCFIVEVGKQLCDPVADLKNARAVSAMLYLYGDNRGLLGVSRYVDSSAPPAGKPILFHQPDSWKHKLVQIAAIIPILRRLGYPLVFKTVKPEEMHTDELRGYTFFEDGSVWLKHWLRRFLIPVSIRQMSFLVPAEFSVSAQADDLLYTFLTTTDIQLDQHELVPAIIDVIYLPPDPAPGFLLSSTRKAGGFLVSIAFEKLFSKNFTKEEAFFRRLAHEIVALGGRVHLVKNVAAEKADILASYGAELAAMTQLRQRLSKGPSSGPTLSSSFSERIDLS